MRAYTGGALAGGITAAAMVAGLSAINNPAIAGTDAGAGQPTQSTIAVVDLYGILETSLQDPAALNEREGAASVFTGQLETLQAELQEISTKVQELGFDNPESQPLIGEFQQKQQQAQQIQGQLQQLVTQLYAEQMQTGYNKIMATANEVAEEGGYDIVIASRPADRVLEQGPVEVMIQELLARPVIKAPNAIDLTTQVRERLGLPEVTEEDAAGDGAADEAASEEPASP